MKTGMKAIVVDDEPLTSEYIGWLLAQAGVDVIACCTEPKAALELIGRHRPDALFLDIEMPEMSGLTLAERANEDGYEGEIVFITAYPDYAIDAFRVNAQNYLLKPVLEEQMNAALERLDRRRDKRSSQSTTVHSGSRAFASFFGTFSLYLGDSPSPVRWPTAKCAELFAFMLLQGANREISKWVLIEALWKDKSAEKADVNLRSTVSRINRTLRGEGSDIALVSVKNGYRLERSGVEIKADAFRIESCALDGSRIGADDFERVAAWTSRCERPFLEHFDGEWCERYRLQYGRYLTEVGRKLLSFCEESEYEPQKMLGLADMLLRHEPYVEPIRASALRLREKHEGRAQALAYYLDYAAMLSRELGTEPGEELRAIYRRWALLGQDDH